MWKASCSLIAGVSTMRAQGKVGRAEVCITTKRGYRFRGNGAEMMDAVRAIRDALEHHAARESVADELEQGRREEAAQLLKRWPVAFLPRARSSFNKKEANDD